MRLGAFLLFYALVFVNLVNLLHLGMFMVGANAYDIVKFRASKKHRKAVAHTQRKQPLVSVVVPAHNEAIVIKRTLDSILASRYKQYEIVVIDDGSTDKTAAVVRRYIKRHPQLAPDSYTAVYDWSRAGHKQRRYICGQIDGRRIVLVSQTNGGKASAMNNAIARHVRGTLTMCLDADSILHPDAIANATVYFQDRRVMGVAANVRIMASKHWLSMLQQFEHLIGYRSKKFYSLTNSEFIVGGVASTYRTSILKRAGLYDTDTVTEDIGLSLKLIAKKGNRRHRLIYASDVVAMTEGVQTYANLLRQRYRWKLGSLQNLFKYRGLINNGNHAKYNRMLAAYRLPMAMVGELLLIAEPLLLVYIAYLSIHFHTPGIILGAYITLTVYVLCAVWPDENMTNNQKARLSLSAAGMYVLFYTMTIVQLYAVSKCLLNWRKIAGGSTEQTWTSPTRSGQPGSFD